MPHPDRAVFHLVRGVIHAWDPYALLRSGAPDDEWDGEIDSLVGQIPRIRSENDAAQAVSRVFSASFQAEHFTPEDCAAVGRALFAALVREGVVSHDG